MSDLVQIAKALVDTPLPTLLFVAGIIFLFFSFVDVINFYPPPESRPWLRVFGIVFLVAGVFLYVASHSNQVSSPNSTTAQQVQPTPPPAQLTITAMLSSTAPPIPSPTFTKTWTPSPTATSTPTPTPFFGTTRKVQMSSGMLSMNKHQAIPEHLNFSNDDKSKNLCVYVESYGHPMRVELWAGNIPKENDRWWETFQMVMQDPLGVMWKSKINPKLAYTVIPGEYTLLVIHWLQEDPTPDIGIEYSMFLLSSSCPPNKP